MPFKQRSQVNREVGFRYGTSDDWICRFSEKSCEQKLDRVSPLKTDHPLCRWTTLSNIYIYIYICSTLRSWLREISTKIKSCPLDWRTTIHWNVILALFQHNHICQDCWKNTRSSFECMVILQSRGQGPDAC